MCGRYASARKRIELLEEFSVQRDKVAEPLEPDYNVAPTKPVYAVMTRERRDDRAGDDRAGDQPAGANDHPGAVRELRVIRWGLVPFWAKDIAIGSRLINARAETVSEKPAFRHAFAKRRCLLPADGYYEWMKLEGPQGQNGAVQEGRPAKAVAKQPYYITKKDGSSLAFAGLYELWRDKAVPDGDPDAWLWSATIITTSAPDELGKIHDRMPMVIDRDRWADWLDPASTDPSELRLLMVPATASGLTTFPVSKAVNSVRNNGPRLIEPVEAGLLAPLAPASASGSSGSADALF
jgi:putative SOS response-associated peptidase YedK